MKIKKSPCSLRFSPIILFLLYLLLGTCTIGVCFCLNNVNVINSRCQFGEDEDFKIEEATIQDIQRAFALRKLTSRKLVDFYINQIETLNPVLRGVIEVNPDAQDQANEADRIRDNSINNSSSLNDMHGIPILLKDAINTYDKLNTTAGSYALLGSKVARDAGVVERLRKAGAVILGKSSMSEWYHLRDVSLPEGWCPRSGQGVVSFFFF